MGKLALLLHLKKKPKIVEPATKEDIIQIRTDIIATLMMLNPRQKLRLLRLMAKRKKV